jgi:hypothetical protein
MLRINLLPAYIAERRKRNLAIVVSIFMVALPCVALMVYYTSLKAQAADEKQLADDTEQKKADIDAINAKAQSTLDKVKPIIDKVAFVDNIHFYNTLPGRIYSQAARYTIPQAEYNSMSASGTTLAMTGFIAGQSGPDAVANFGRYLVTFFGNPDITALSVNGLPGYPSPSTGTGTGNAVAPVMGGGYRGGPPGGFNGPPGGGFNGPPGGGQNGPPGGFPGAGGFGANGLNIPAVPPQPGFPFSATATLKHAVAPPDVPSGLTGGGGGGGLGGPGGGFGGGPPGGFNGPPGGFNGPPGGFRNGPPGG